MNELGKDLCTAAFMGSLSFLEDVLSVSDASTANLTDNVGDTPLHRAVVAGQLECAHILLENKGTALEPYGKKLVLLCLTISLTVSTPVH